MDPLAQAPACTHERTRPRAPRRRRALALGYGSSLALHGAAALAALGLASPDPGSGPTEGWRPTLWVAQAEASARAALDPRPEARLEPQLPEDTPSEPELVRSEETTPLPTEPTPEPAPTYADLPLEDLLARIDPRLFEPVATAIRSAPEEPDGQADAPPAAPPSAAPARDTLPELLPGHGRHPGYPRRAQRLGWEGVAILLIAVDAEGRVSRVSLESSSGHALLDQAALDAARTWRFHPASRAGRPVEMEIRLPVSFELGRGAGPGRPGLRP